MKIPLSYSLIDEGGNKVAGGEASARLNDESLAILPYLGEVLFFAHKDILKTSAHDYKIELTLSSKEKLLLSDLGYKYEDFIRSLTKLRNDMLIKELLMNESIKKAGMEAEFVYFDETGKETQKGKCEPRLYDTGMVILPDTGDFLRIPYSDIAEIKEQDYSLIVTNVLGDRIIFSKMGTRFDSFKSAISDILNDLLLKAQMSLSQLLPRANPAHIRKAARFMKEGQVARRSDIESVSPQLWIDLEKKLETIGMNERYNFLKPLGQEQKLCIGLKRGLMGDLTGDYIWFLVPIYSINPKAPGNAVVIEAAASVGGGKATYCFRITSRTVYHNFSKIEDLHNEVDAFIRKMNRCMLAVNFRREPIYLSAEKLEEPQYQKYKTAVTKIPELQLLRELFIGRIIHSSLEQWKEDVMNLLNFNVTTTDNSLKWKRPGGELPEPEPEISPEEPPAANPDTPPAPGMSNKPAEPANKDDIDEEE